MKRILTFVLAVMLVLPFLFVPALASPIGDGVTETSGDGYSLYNGVKLPSIDTIDLSLYEFDTFLVRNNLNGQYMLFLFTYEQSVVTSTRVRLYTPAAFFLLVDGIWSFQSTYDPAVNPSISFGISEFTFICCEKPLLKSDGHIAYESGNILSLDNMIVIEWDGSVTNHNYLADHLWRVSDLTPSINQLTGGYSVFKSVSTGNLTVATLNVGSTLTQEDGYIYFTGGGVYPNSNSPGIYFHKNNSDPVAEQVQTQLLAFSATEGGGGGVQPDPSDPTDPSVPDDPTDPTVSVDEKLDQIQQDQVIIQDTLDQIQSDQIITNDKLDQIDQNQGITNDKLDDIINDTVTPDIPSGGDIITDNDDLESQIKDDITPGIDSIGDWFTDSLETFEEYSGVFIIIIWLFDKIVDIGFFKPLLAIALSLGVVCSILGIGMTIANKPKRGD